jgi:Cu2+-exporting ATPase
LLIPSACSGGTDSKACSQHRLTILDQYGATLEAQGCICRTLIETGQTACCEVRDCPQVDRKQCSKISSARSLLRPSLDSHSSGGSATEGQTVQSSLRLRKGSGESVRSHKKPSTTTCTGPGPSKNKPGEELCVIGRHSSLRCSVGEAVSGPSSIDTSTGSCCSQGLIVNARTEIISPGSCCMDSKAIDEVPTRIKCLGSCCPNKSVESSCLKGRCAKPRRLFEQPVAQLGCRDSCYLEIPRVKESPSKVD